jgi:NADPH-dependent 2,4-dienoyl-CoA reductase/sulfur reductase-like enzyme
LVVNVTVSAYLNILEIPMVIGHIRGYITMKYDVIIVGAGPAGSSAAYYLAAAGRKVLVLEKETFPRYKACAGEYQ